ncbi:MAG TPA: CBS domain-containing protein [Planctomycetota bacterium]|jgi:CBS domain-containing protein|nr:CBS domain-containing protein [Planctomycetota bacterium]
MLVRDAAVQEVLTAREDASLAEAGTLLRNADCGALPVVDADYRLVGFLTDRDIAMALADADASASAVRVGEVMTRDLQTSRPDEDVRAALRRMAEHGIRRLPVCTPDQKLLGILSIDDLLLAERRELDDRELLDALRRIARGYREKREARIIEEHPTV